MDIKSKSEYILQRLETKKRLFTKIFNDIDCFTEKLNSDKTNLTIVKLENPSKEEMNLREENLNLLQKYIDNLEKIIEVKENEI